jgi:cytochrome c oxidase subunit 1
MIIGPSVVIRACTIISLYGAQIRYGADAVRDFVSADVCDRRLTGLPLGLTASDILCMTPNTSSHFHYVVAPGTIFAMFAGIYFWFPKVTGRMMSETLGKVHWFFSFVFINVVFMPMFFQGMAGLLRRQYDQTEQLHGSIAHGLTKMSSWGVWMLALAQLPFIINFVWSIFAGRKVGPNPWNATTLEWAAPSPPPHGNFGCTRGVLRSHTNTAASHDTDFCPQLARRFCCPTRDTSRYRTASIPGMATEFGVWHFWPRK